MNKNNWNRITFISVLAMIGLLIICIFYKKVISKKKGYDKVKYIEDNDDIHHDDI